MRTPSSPCPQGLAFLWEGQEAQYLQATLSWTVCRLQGPAGCSVSLRNCEQRAATLLQECTNVSHTLFLTLSRKTEETERERRGRNEENTKGKREAQVHLEAEAHK